MIVFFFCFLPDRKKIIGYVLWNTNYFLFWKQFFRVVFYIFRTCNNTVNDLSKLYNLIMLGHRARVQYSPVIIIHIYIKYYLHPLFFKLLGEPKRFIVEFLLKNHDVVFFPRDRKSV